MIKKNKVMAAKAGNKVAFMTDGIVERAEKKA